MRIKGLFIAVLSLLFVAAAPAISHAADTPSLEAITADRVLGRANAPVTIIEYASLTCSHCAHFENDILPELEKQAIETGKAKLIYRDFPLDGTALKAAALARCLPAEQYYPFVKMLFASQASWASADKPEELLAKRAALAGLSLETAKACMSDTKILDAIAQMRTTATDKYKVAATPTFIFNDGAERIDGAADIEKYMAAIDKLTPKKK